MENKQKAETKKVNAFEVIKKLADDNNTGFAMAPLSNVIEVKQNGARCTFLIGVDANAVKNWMLDKTKHGGLFLIDGEAYKEAEKYLSEKPDRDQEKRATAIGFAEWKDDNYIGYQMTGDLYYHKRDLLKHIDEATVFTLAELYDLYLTHLQSQPPKQ